jgi:hypothetical protein
MGLTEKQKQSLRTWKDTGYVDDLKGIGEEIKRIIGEDDFSSLERELSWFADYDEIWLFTNIGQIYKSGLSWLSKENKNDCLNKFLNGKKSVIVILGGCPHEHTPRPEKSILGPYGDWPPDGH